MNPKELTFVLSTLTTLVDNGVSLPKALGTLAKEKRWQNIATRSMGYAESLSPVYHSVPPWKRYLSYVIR